MLEGVKRFFNAYLNGGVVAERPDPLGDEVRIEMQRCELTNDFYDRKGHKVSIEVARLRTLRLQEHLDKQVEAENRGITFIKRGLPPCLRVRLDD